MQTSGTLQKQALNGMFSLAGTDPFAVSFWDGTTKQYGAGTPTFNVVLHNPAVLDRLTADGEVGICEAYMDGLYDVEGDLADFVAMVQLNLRRLSGNGTTSSKPHSAIAGLVPALMVKMSRQVSSRSKAKQKHDVAHHYDIGNDFFRLWLDETMSYSCAYFRSPEDTLDQAQCQKIDYSLRKLNLSSEENLLDIGCGWGALVLRAAERYGVHACGITLSEEQLAAGCREIEVRGLGHQANVRLCHYAALAREGKQFDKIVSIGMVEHVGKAHLPEFSQVVARLLRPGGTALLHQITSPIEGPFNAWLDKYIFPGAYLPTVPELLGHLAANDLHILDVEDLRPHYQMTLDLWSERFEQHIPEIRAQFGEEFVRMWRLYLRSSSASFRTGTVAVHQVLVSHGVADSAPLTRDGLYND
jgi:cyclopropane-fatty-acyl-phospholipid synthase